jgi:hypothetical protein
MVAMVGSVAPAGVAVESISLMKIASLIQGKDPLPRMLPSTMRTVIFLRMMIAQHYQQ